MGSVPMLSMLIFASENVTESISENFPLTLSVIYSKKILWWIYGTKVLWCNGYHFGL